MDTPIVSVYTTTYNHAPFIRQCIEGIVMQQTKFTFRFIIHDDASTDGTAEIIREYEALYPNLIIAIYQTENHFSQGKNYYKYIIPHLTGKYVAQCEGDDYWIDPLKLQKQVDFLENNPEYSICGGRYWVMDNDKPDELSERDWMIKGMAKFPNGKTITLDTIFDDYLFWTLTTCFKREILDGLSKINSARDDAVFAVALEYGKGFVFPDYFGVYRLHKGGIWSATSEKERVNLSELIVKRMYPYYYKKSKSFRKYYYRAIIRLRFLELADSKNLFKDYWKMIQFTLSGSFDTFGYRILRFINMSWKRVFSKIQKKICPKATKQELTTQKMF